MKTSMTKLRRNFGSPFGPSKLVRSYTLATPSRWRRADS